MVTGGSRLVRYMKTAAVELQLDTYKLKTTLKPYCDTRWNSVHVMFNSIETNYAEISQILSEKEQSSRNYRNDNELFFFPLLDIMSVTLFSTILDK